MNNTCVLEEKKEMVDSGRKKTFIDKLLFALKPKKNKTDIVDYAERIIDDYTGHTSGRAGRGKTVGRLTALIFPITAAIVICILCYALKIFL